LVHFVCNKTKGRIEKNNEKYKFIYTKRESIGKEIADVVYINCSIDRSALGISGWSRIPTLVERFYLSSISSNRERKCLYTFFTFLTDFRGKFVVIVVVFVAFVKPFFFSST
jgi:hypothetical protein